MMVWEDLNRFVAELKEIFGRKFSAIEVFFVAASPKTTGAPKGEGLDELLTFWINSRRVVLSDEGKEVVPARAFGKLRVKETEKIDEC